MPVPVRGVFAQAARGRRTDQRQSSRRSPAGGARSRTWRPRRCSTWRWCTTCSRRSAPPRTSARPNLPAPAHHYPAGVNLTLVPFGEPALRHFIFLERPEGMALKGAAGIDAPLHEAVPLMAERDIVPQPQDFATVGHLYRSIEQGLAHLAEKFGERNLFVGPPRAQAIPANFQWPELVAVTDLATAAAGDRHDPRAGRGRARPLGARRTSASSFRSWTSTARCSRRIPSFDPVRPVMFATVRRCEHDETVPQIAERVTSRCSRPVQRQLRDLAADDGALLRAHRGDGRAAGDACRRDGRAHAARAQTAWEPDHHAARRRCTSGG